MKKLLLLCSCIAAMLIVMSGCAKMYSDIKITNDKINVETNVFIEKEYLDNFIKNGDLDTMAAMYYKEVINAMSVVEMDGVSYYKYKSTSSETFKDYMFDMDLMYEGSKFYVDKNTVYSYTGKSLNDLLGGQLNDVNTPIDDSKITVSETMTFNAPIVNTTGTIDKDNPNKVTFEYNGASAKTVKEFATTDKKVTLASIEKMIKESNTIGKPSIKKLTANKVKKKAKKATVTVKISKVKTAKIYYINYATNKKFKKSSYKKTTKTTVKLTKLKRKKTYWVRASAEKENYAGVDVDGKYGKSKKVKTK